MFALDIIAIAMVDLSCSGHLLYMSIVIHNQQLLMLPTSSRGNTGQKDSALGAAYGAIATYNVHRSVNDAIAGFGIHSNRTFATSRNIWRTIAMTF